MTTCPASRAPRSLANNSLRQRALAHALWVTALLAGCADEKAEASAADEGTTIPLEEFDPQMGRAIVLDDGRELDAYTRIPKDAPVPQAARDTLKEYLQTMIQPPLDVTSDIYDAWLKRTRTMTAELQAGDEHIGNAALHAFTGNATPDYHTRRLLLAIGAHAAPGSAKELFHELTWTYGYNIEDRAEACQLLPLVDPEGFLERAQEYLTHRGRKTKTMPPDEFLMEAWIASCEALGRSPVDMCVDVATNFWLEPRARYMAVTELGKHGSHPMARGALELCLVESSGDGMLRIKAAQAIAEGYPREAACQLLEEVLAHEVSLNFQEFLIDLVSKHCDGE